MESWNTKFLNIRRCQVKEPTFDDMTDFIEEETVLMNDPLFSRVALADYHTKLERPFRKKRMKNYTVKAKDENKKDVKGSSEDKSSKCKICNGRDDLDECKTFNYMTVQEKSKFLSKHKLCYGCYEVISPKHTARNCPRRKNCNIFMATHPTSLHGYKIRRKDDSKSDDDSGKTVKSKCANIKDVQCESVRTGEVLSMCVVLVKFQHKNSDKEIMTFVMLDTCSQSTFITTSLMEQLNVSGIQTFINIKTIIGHQKESSYTVEGLSVSKATVSDGNPKWIKLPSAFSKKQIPVNYCEIVTAR